MNEPDLDRIASKHGLLMIVQFGSTATGKTHDQSDMDLAVQFSVPPATLTARAAVVADLQVLFPDRPVDMVILNHADPLLMKKVVESGRLLHGSLRRYQEFRILAYKRYQDHRRFFTMEREYVRRALEKVASDDGR
jgi:predicted nucleotidyltransferase